MLTGNANAIGFDALSLSAPRLHITHDVISVFQGASMEEVPAAVATYDYGHMDQEFTDRYFLESLGMVEVDHLADCVVSPTCKADYFIAFGDDALAICNFVKYSLPQLENMGWEVSVADDFPWQVMDENTPWYQEWKDDGQDWFTLELGIEIEGQRVNLMPALLDILNSCRDLDSLCRSRRKIVPLEVGDNRFLPVPTQKMRGIFETLAEIYNGEEQGFAAPSTRIDDISDRLCISEHDKPTVKRPKVSANTTHSQMQEATPPKGLQATLRPYQAKGLSWMQHIARFGGGILADDMGLGKTLQTIAHLLIEKESGRMTSPTLIVAPTSLLHNWQREIAKFAPSLSCEIYHGANRIRTVDALRSPDILVTSYSLAHRDQQLFEQINWHYIVLDEAHYIKNPDGTTHKAICGLPSKHRLALTGTPIENNIGELWSIFHFVNPALLGSRERFRANFQIPIESSESEGKLAALRQRVEPFIMRRLKEQVATELPGKTEIVRAVELGEQQRHLYESIRLAAHKDVRRAIAKRGFNRSTIRILDALLKLRQVCCDPRLVKLPSARRVKQSAKMHALLELVSTQLNQGRRVLIFSQFTKMLGLIESELKKRHIATLKLTGATRDRQRLVDQFNKKVANVFLLSLKAAGVGLNLVSADTVIHVDPWWNPTTQAQATDRAYRIGQQKPVVVYKLIVAGSVEERMLQIQEKKDQLAKAMLEGHASKSTRLTEDDVMDLFAELED